MLKRSISLIISLLMVLSCIAPSTVFAASTVYYDVMFFDENGEQIDSTYKVKKGTYIDESLIPVLPKGTDGNEYIADEGGKNHSSYSWDIDPETTAIYSNTIFTRVRTVEKHDYNFGKPQFKFQANNKSGLMAFYECSKCGSIGEVGVEIVGANLTEGVKVRVDGSAIGGDGIAYEGNIDVGEIKTLVGLMQKVGVPIPGWVNTVLTVADTVLGVADQIVERTSTCAKQGHLYGEEPRYTWNDTHTVCVATFTCTREDCHTNYTDHYKDVTMFVTPPVYTNATCTQNGEAVYVAQVDFQRGNELDRERFTTEYKEVWQKKLGHNYGSPVSNGDATCYEDGTTSTVCERCGKVIVNPDIGSKLEHLPGRVIRENEQPATCTSAGSYEEVRKCIYCDLELSRNNVAVDKTAHTPLAAVIENYVEATCENEGSYDSVVHCADCNAILSSSHVTVPKKEHNIRNVVDNYSEATCTEGGTFTRKTMCIDCNKVFSTEEVVIPAADHDYEDVVTPATCKEEGSIYKVCKVCGYSYKDETLEQISEHKYVTTFDRAPTCTEKGETVKECSICGDIVTTIIEKKPHADGAGVVTEPTCTENGYTTYTCSVCGRTREDNPVPSTGHKFTDKVTAPTCETAGYTTYTCTKCGYSYKTEYVPATGHTLGIIEKQNEVKSTCTVNGSYDLVVKCSVCNKEIERDHIVSKLAAHTISTHNEAPTCTHEGYTSDKCEICGYEFKVNIDCIDHKAGKPVNEVVVPVSCTKDGRTDKVVYCTMCNKELSREPSVINHTGHKWNSGIITKQPTTEETGIKTYTCKNCGLTKTEVLDKLTVAEATPDDKDADSASVNKKIKKPQNINTISQIKQKRLLIRFDAVPGAQNYRVMYRKAGTKKWNYAWTDCKTEYYLKNLKTGGLYEFMFAAYKKNEKNVWERGAYSKISTRYYKKQTIKKLTAGKKSIKVNWSYDKNSNGYELFYSTTPDMTKRKRIVIKNKKKTSYTIKKLKSGKKYYIRVRSIKKKNGKSYIGEYSSQKKIKAK